jgi:nucleoside-diphosphate-sugar epimerase
MNILITGNMGYIGPVVAKHLICNFKPLSLVGLDSGYFASCLVNNNIFPEVVYDKQYFVDIRDISDQHLEGIDSVVHLAAISNDPMGSLYEKQTDEINAAASINLANIAKRNGVKSFVFASSCSVYGSSGGGSRNEEDEVNPLTTYARSKIFVENSLKEIADENFVVTALRFATACGFSPRLRLDLVLNDFVANALLSRRIEILSDGTPWRPLIHIADMARAIEWAIFRDHKNSKSFLSVNTGSKNWNYQVQDLAIAVQKVIPGISIDINKNAAIDKRSYKVAFDLYEKLAPNHQPIFTLAETINQLVNGIQKAGLNLNDFRNSNFIRLRTLQVLQSSHELDPNLRWSKRFIGVEI